MTVYSGIVVTHYGRTRRPVNPVLIKKRIYSFQNQIKENENLTKEMHKHHPKMRNFSMNIVLVIFLVQINCTEYSIADYTEKPEKDLDVHSKPDGAVERNEISSDCYFHFKAVKKSKKITFLNSSSTKEKALESSHVEQDDYNKSLDEILEIIEEIRESLNNDLDSMNQIIPPENPPTKAGFSSVISEVSENAGDFDESFNEQCLKSDKTGVSKEAKKEGEIDDIGPSFNFFVEFHSKALEKVAELREKIEIYQNRVGSSSQESENPSLEQKNTKSFLSIEDQRGAIAILIVCILCLAIGYVIGA